MIITSGPWAPIKRPISLAVLVALVATLAACGSGDDNDANTAAAPAAPATPASPPASAASAPSSSLQITVDGNHGYTLSGSAFGAAPLNLIHDDFDQGAPGGPLTGWSLGSNTGQQNPSYSQSFSVTGAQAGMSSFIGSNYNSSAEYKHLGGQTKIYLSYYVLIERLPGQVASRNLKLARLSAGHDDTYGYQLATGVTAYGNYSNSTIYTAISNKAEEGMTEWYGNFDDATWHRIEHYVELSQPAGAANGMSIARIDGKVEMSHVQTVTETLGLKLNWLTLPFYRGTGPGGDYRMHYDNVVVSTSQARVEACASATYAACTQPVVVKLDDWTDTQVHFHFADSQRTAPYFYLFRADGTLVNAQGLAP